MNLTYLINKVNKKLSALCLNTVISSVRLKPQDGLFSQPDQANVFNYEINNCIFSLIPQFNSIQFIRKWVCDFDFWLELNLHHLRANMVRTLASVSMAVIKIDICSQFSTFFRCYSWLGKAIELLLELQFVEQMTVSYQNVDFKVVACQ